MAGPFFFDQIASFNLAHPSRLTEDLFADKQALFHRKISDLDT
jgi:hypothetical protein